MLDIPGRRGFLRVGAASLIGLTTADWFRLKGQAAAAAPRAKSVIQLWMAGGPTHTDTWDPKPNAGEDFTGPLRRTLPTNVNGIAISELLPLSAKQADKYTIIRSMTHGDNGHETAAYIMQTGGNPNNANFRVQGLVPPRGMTEQRINERRGLLKSVDALAAQADKQEVYREMDEFQQKAYGLILGDARKAFDLTEEKDAARDRYGRNQFGQSCLLARRLVEAGVPFITINDGGWDTHKDNFEAMRKKLPIQDQGISALRQVFEQRR